MKLQKSNAFQILRTDAGVQSSAYFECTTYVNPNLSNS